MKETPKNTGRHFHNHLDYRLSNHQTTACETEGLCVTGTLSSLHSEHHRNPVNSETCHLQKHKDDFAFVASVRTLGIDILFTGCGNDVYKTKEMIVDFRKSIVFPSWETREWRTTNTWMPGQQIGFKMQH